LQLGLIFFGSLVDGGEVGSEIVYFTVGGFLDSFEPDDLALRDLQLFIAVVGCFFKLADLGSGVV
jgi:hypothetical protein